MRSINDVASTSATHAAAGAIPDGLHDEYRYAPQSRYEGPIYQTMHGEVLRAPSARVVGDDLLRARVFDQGQARDLGPRRVLIVLPQLGNSSDPDDESPEDVILRPRIRSASGKLQPRIQ